MASFDEGFKLILKYEGGYVNDPDDQGGETYIGISRKYHKDWPGWARLDAIKQIKRINNGDILSAGEYPELYSDVKEFYRINYWNRVRADEIFVQDLANELLDIGIHFNISKAVKLLQEGLNIFNINEKLWDDIETDGAIGENTLRAINYAYIKGKMGTIIKYLNCEQGHMYKESIQGRSINEKYAYNWFSRV